MTPERAVWEGTTRCTMCGGAGWIRKTAPLPKLEGTPHMTHERREVASVYWVLLWKQDASNENWAWLRKEDPNDDECTSSNPWERKRYFSKLAARAGRAIFMRDRGESNCPHERLTVVRVTIRRRWAQ